MVFLEMKRKLRCPAFEPFFMAEIFQFSKVDKTCMSGKSQNLFRSAQDLCVYATRPS